jgi:hypothetical protein
MLTLFIALVTGFIIGILSTSQWGYIWGTIFGLASMVAIQIVIGLIVRKKVNKINLNIQEIMTEAQKSINRKIQMFQRKPQGNPKLMQQQLEKEQNAHLRKVLEKIDEMRPLSKWQFLFAKQINTMKMIYHYQLREFDQVDKLIPRALYFDGRAVAIKMARMYKKNQEGIDKVFEKKRKKFKGANATLLYALYSWILVKQDKLDEALKVLIEGKAKTSDETIARNWEMLVNNQPKHFSNAGLGDDWYSLYLEEPKVKAQRQRQSQSQRHPF